MAAIRPRRLAGVALAALAVAGCLSPAVHGTAAATPRRPTPVARERRRVEAAARPPGRVIQGPQVGYPGIPGAPTPYSDWEVPWDWTYGPVLDSHRGAHRDLQRLERKADDLSRSGGTSRPARDGEDDERK